MLTIQSEDNLEYVITPFHATSAALTYLWEEVGKYDFLFSDRTLNDRDTFMQRVLAYDTIIQVVTQGTEPVGILYADRVVPGLNARVHYLFWDRRTRGRHKLILTVLKYFMDEFQLHRVDIEIPAHAGSGLSRAMYLGLCFEGMKREVIPYRGGMSNIVLFGVLAEELTEEAIEAAKLPRTPRETRSYGIFHRYMRRKDVGISRGHNGPESDQRGPDSSEPPSYPRRISSADEGSSTAAAEANP